MGIAANRASLKHLYAPSIGLLLLGTLIVLIADFKIPYFGPLELWSLPLGIFLGAISYSIVFLVITGPYKEQFQPDIDKLLNLSKTFRLRDVVILSALAGFGEELIFRVIIQGALSSMTIEVIALLATALIFALLHAVSIYYFLATLVIGIVFGVAYSVTDSFLLVAVWHTSYDLLALGLMRFKPHLFY